MTVQITHATEMDCQDVASFLATALPESWRQPELPDCAQIQRVLQHNASILMIARQDDIVVGLALGWCFPNAVAQGDSVMLDELLVASGCRGIGIGTELVEAFTKTARQLGKAPVEVWATTDFPDEPAATPFARTGGQQGELLRQFDWSKEACA
ncbi:GNAT family N-acetyltransferase [uncultured Tateyamaria sp.]|uniref:GNAT family N-acetyltransferase n=1 Tax=uncultured Tateyamaria sp. TaxID=455651 RepID=UPI002633F6AC|nr:GNAT family N-acetyltransferase [uncultured Tateyamaria sp.]